jgi:hypothetical protein
MILNSPYITGSATITGNLNVNGTISGTISGTSSYADNANLLDGRDSLTFANTGSNSFVGQQNINGSVAVTGSLTTTGVITAQSINVQQVTSSIVYSSGSNIFGNSVSNTQSMTGSLQVSGSTHYLFGTIGIGMTNPFFGLDIASSSTSQTVLRITKTGGAEVFLQSFDDAAYFGTINSFPISINTGGSERMRITSGGNVLIGTTTDAGFRLDVNGTGRFTGQVTIKSGNGNQLVLDNAGERYTQMYFFNNNTYKSAIWWDNNTSKFEFYTGVTALSIASTGAATFEIPVESPALGTVCLTAKTSNGANDIFRWFDGATQLGVFKNSGNVGIGTANPNILGTSFTNQFTVSTTSGFANIAAAGATGSGGGLDLGTQTIRQAGIYSLDGSNLALYTNGTNSGSSITERMRITSAGNVEIRSAGQLIAYRSDNTRWGSFYTDNTAVHLTSSTDPIRLSSADRTEFYTGGSERMRITSGGKVNINNTANTTYELYVNGASYLDGYNYASSIQFTRAASNSVTPAGGNGILVFAVVMLR